MPEDRSTQHPTLALNTKVEEDFVAPLTAVRGSLEILRDFDELSDIERHRFISTALRSCSKLEIAIRDLATTVYEASEHALHEQQLQEEVQTGNVYQARLQLHRDLDMVEVDFSEFKFTSSTIVNEFYDAIEAEFEAGGGEFYLLVNFQNCSIWPEAWVAFAHRGKRLNVNYSLGTVRYAETDDAESAENTNPDILSSREAALAEIEQIKLTKSA